MEGDITKIALTDQSFDLIHARPLLHFLPEEVRSQVLLRLLSALRPGGWLAVVSPGEPQRRVPVHPRHPGSQRVEDLWNKLSDFILEALGIDNYYGNQLPGLLQEAGLVSIHSEGNAIAFQGGSRHAKFWQASWSPAFPMGQEAGIFADGDQEFFLHTLDDPTYYGLSVNWVAARGRRNQ